LHVHIFILPVVFLFTLFPIMYGTLAKISIQCRASIRHAIKQPYAPHINLQCRAKDYLNCVSTYALHAAERTFLNYSASIQCSSLYKQDSAAWKNCNINAFLFNAAFISIESSFVAQIRKITDIIKKFPALLN
jgi:hypothetical protein